jgi:hypothetical protein
MLKLSLVLEVLVFLVILGPAGPLGPGGPITRQKRQADYVILSIHSHEVPNGLEIPADFIRDFEIKCIDYGTLADIGHCPHTIGGN